MYEGVKGQVVL